MAQQWPPKKNTAFTVVFPIRGSDGAPVTGVAGLDSERSIDGGSFADCTNEATEIGTTGFYSLTLSTSDMNGDFIAVQVKSTLYPAVGFFFCTTESTWDEGIDTKAVLTGAIVAGSFGAGAIDASAIAANAIGSSELADGAITAAKIATGAIDADALAADASTEINAAVLAILGTPAGASVSADILAVDNLVDDLESRLGTPSDLFSGATVAFNLSDISARIPSTMSGGRMRSAVEAFQSDALTAAALAADAIAEIAAGVTALRKNVALAAFPFFMRDSADHVSPKTGLTVTAERSLDGAAFGACANAVAEVSAGWYKISLDAADLNATTVALKFTSAGADPTELTIVTQT